MRAEDAYLFRHAVLRDAAYQVQLPGDRARLHELAFRIIESLHGGPAPEPPPLDAIDPPRMQPHPTDGVAEELAYHARVAREANDSSLAGFSRAYVRYLHRAAEIASRQFRPAMAAELWRLLAVEISGAARGEALRLAADELASAGMGPAARLALEQALALFREGGHRLHEFKTAGQLGLLLHQFGETKEAMQLLESAVQGLAESGAHRLAAAALNNVAMIQMHAGNHDSAEARIREVLATASRLQLQGLEGEALTHLASLNQLRGRLDEAQELYSRALALHRKAGNRTFECATLGNLAGVNLETRRFDRADDYFHQTVEICRATGFRRSLAIALGNHAVSLSRRGQKQQAIEEFEQAIAINREIGNLRSEGVALGNLAETLHETGKSEQAARYFEAALAIHQRVGNPYHHGVHLCGFARCLLALGRRHEAEANWRKGSLLMQQLGDASSLEHQRGLMVSECSLLGQAPIDPHA